MKVVVASAAGIVVEDNLPPRLELGQVAIRTAHSLISPGTELFYADRARQSGERIRLGYCVAGTVQEVAADVSDFHVGDEVAAMGWGYACHSEHVCVPYRLCVRWSGTRGLDQAPFTSLTATAIHAVHRAHLAAQSSVLVVGLGLVGQLVAQCARAAGATVYAWDVAASRVAVARQAGVHAIEATVPEELREYLVKETGRQGLDAVFICISGDASALLAVVPQLMKGAVDGEKFGVVIGVGRFYASCHFSVDMGNLDIRYAARCGLGYKDDEYVHGRREYITQEPTVDENLKAASRFVAGGGLPLGAIHTHRFSLKDAAEAYELVRQRGSAIGVTLSYP